MSGVLNETELLDLLGSSPDISGDENFPELNDEELASLLGEKSESDKAKEKLPPPAKAPEKPLDVAKTEEKAKPKATDPLPQSTEKDSGDETKKEGSKDAPLPTATPPPVRAPVAADAAEDTPPKKGDNASEPQDQNEPPVGLEEAAGDQEESVRSSEEASAPASQRASHPPDTSTPPEPIVPSHPGPAPSAALTPSADKREEEEEARDKPQSSHSSSNKDNTLSDRPSEIPVKSETRERAENLSDSIRNSEARQEASKKEEPLSKTSGAPSSSSPLPSGSPRASMQTAQEESLTLRTDGEGEDGEMQLHSARSQDFHSPLAPPAAAATLGLRGSTQSPRHLSPRDALPPPSQGQERERHAEALRMSSGGSFETPQQVSSRTNKSDTSLPYQTATVEADRGAKGTRDREKEKERNKTSPLSGEDTAGLLDLAAPGGDSSLHSLVKALIRASSFSSLLGAAKIGGKGGGRNQAIEEQSEWNVLRRAVEKVVVCRGEEASQRKRRAEELEKALGEFSKKRGDRGSGKSCGRERDRLESSLDSLKKEKTRLEAEGEAERSGSSAVTLRLVAEKEEALRKAAEEKTLRTHLEAEMVSIQSARMADRIELERMHETLGAIQETLAQETTQRQMRVQERIVWKQETASLHRRLSALKKANAHLAKHFSLMAGKQRESTGVLERLQARENERLQEDAEREEEEAAYATLAACFARKGQPQSKSGNLPPASGQPRHGATSSPCLAMQTALEGEGVPEEGGGQEEDVQELRERLEEATQRMEALKQMYSSWRIAVLKNQANGTSSSQVAPPHLEALSLETVRPPSSPSHTMSRSPSPSPPLVRQIPIPSQQAYASSSLYPSPHPQAGPHATPQIPQRPAASGPDLSPLAPSTVLVPTDPAGSPPYRDIAALRAAYMAAASGHHPAGRNMNPEVSPATTWADESRRLGGHHQRVFPHPGAPHFVGGSLPVPPGMTLGEMMYRPIQGPLVEGRQGLPSNFQFGGAPHRLEAGEVEMMRDRGEGTTMRMRRVMTADIALQVAAAVPELPPESSYVHLPVEQVAALWILWKSKLELVHDLVRLRHRSDRFSSVVSRCSRLMDDSLSEKDAELPSETQAQDSEGANGAGTASSSADAVAAGALKETDMRFRFLLGRVAERMSQTELQLAASVFLLSHPLQMMELRRLVEESAASQITPVASRMAASASHLLAEKVLGPRMADDSESRGGGPLARDVH
uniref:Uncharacterized protein n=1 Tax=Chromera velia CCMP2878 TaxID=1169474 RepID=A0A0G4G3P6_9ALVE|eukprot:Cvel_20115.t1-p1 / transcript=Cvel_20115.t1 / gene=Cvel_20115 / organism=Chromera_velia_CCMP2878 / gene_product=hypothetical protein / transcript_product=hypothetical protein / location=Cvel_scaffold1783:8298-15482(+) / protein_length=1222 / sequence_SO=supercontig / SO=protein_coding / is_pseudo=false